MEEELVLRDDPPVEKMSGMDHSLLRMGEPRNRMIITAVLTLEDRIEYEELLTLLEHRLLRFDRFRQRVKTPWYALRPRWTPDPWFDVETHVSHVALPGVGEDALQRFAADVLPLDLDRSTSPWHLWLVEDAGESESNALVLRVDHALGDGFAMLYLLLGMADDPAAIQMPLGEMPSVDSFVRNLEAEERREEMDDREVDGEEPDEPEEASEELAEGDGERILPDASGDVEPSELVEEDAGGLRGRLSVLREAASVAWDVLTMDDQPETAFDADLGRAKRVSWTDAFDLESVREAAHRHDGTVNVVLLAAVAGAFRRYLEEEGDDVDGVTLRCIVPVNLRPLDRRDEQLGNYFGTGFVELPVGVDDAEERTREIQERNSRLKAGTEAYLMYYTYVLGGWLPNFVQKLLERSFHDKATAVVTNVPGPKQEFELSGETVDDVLVWVPTPMDVGVGVAIFSYDGEVRVGFSTDENVVAEPDRLAEEFEREVETLTEAASE